MLHQVFILAVEDGYIRINPSDLVLGDVKRSHNFETPKRHALTIPQQEAFVSYINKSEKYKHWLPLFTFFLGTGCRVSEVVGLRWEDVHMDENYIEINHNMVYYQRDKGKCYFSVTSPKTTAGYRIIPMLPEVKQALLNEKKYQEEVGLTCQASIDGYTDFIFLNRNGFAHNPQTINRTIKRITLAYNEEEIERAERERRAPVLLQFTLDDGTGEDRTILSGIHEYYEPEELVGKTCIAITNLPPRKMMGIDSCGMLISAVHNEEGKEKLHLLMVDEHIPAGAKLY